MSSSAGENKLKREKQKFIEEYKEKYTKGKNMRDRSTFIGRWLFTWINPMIKLSKYTTFDQQYHYPLSTSDTSKTNHERLKIKWEKYIKNKNMDTLRKDGLLSILKVVLSTYWCEMFTLVIQNIFITVLDFLVTYVIFVVLGRLKEGNQDQRAVDHPMIKDILIYLTLGFTIPSVLSIILNCQNSYGVNQLGYKMNSAVKCIIFDKVLKKSSEREDVFTMSEITNLSQVDAVQFDSLPEYLCMAVYSPLEIIVGMVGLYFLMGIAILPASGVVFISLIVNYLISVVYKKSKKSLMGKKDLRGRTVFQLFENIKFVKLCGLENYFILDTLKKKEEELKYIKRMFLWFSISGSFNDMGPQLFIISINAFHIYLTGSLSIQKTFTSILILNIFKRNFRFLPDLMIFLVDIIVSSKRISYYLFSEEIDTSFITYTNVNENDNRGLDLSNGNFYWKDEKVVKMHKEEKELVYSASKSKKNKKEIKKEKLWDMNNRKRLFRGYNKDLGLKESIMDTDGSEIGEEVEGDLEELNKEIDVKLNDIEMQLNRGSCTAIIGKVGSGKSSLLSALLGEMYSLPHTSLHMDKKIAYVSQQSWTISKSIRDNITMGKEFEEERFRDVLRYSCFEEDLNDMPNRELTVIGNKGVNLSGGQKARLAIARALYSDADVYLFDDPISALDIKVGRMVMEKGILEYLKYKTVVVATHALAFLPYFDRILVIDGGRISFNGSYQELKDNPQFEEFTGNNNDQRTTDEELEVKSEKEIKLRKKNSESFIDEAEMEKAISVASTDPIKLMQDKIVNDIFKMEDKAKGKIGWKIFKVYLSMFGWCNMFILLICNPNVT